MDDGTITVCYEWTADEYVASYEMHRQVYAQVSGVNRRDGGVSSSVLLAALLVPLWIVLGILALRQPGFGFNDALLIVLVVVSVPFLLLRRRAAADPRTDFVQRKDGNQRVCYDFTGQGIAIKTDAATLSLAWSAVTRVARGRQGFLFYRDEQTFHWVPLHAFAAGEPEALENFVRGNVSSFVQVL